MWPGPIIRAEEPKGRWGSRFYLSNWLDVRSNYMKTGALVAAPIVLFLFVSRKAGIATLAFEVISYGLGVFINDFDRWWNKESEGKTYDEEGKPRKLSDLEKVIDRLHHFEDKYYISIEGMFVLLESNTFPPKIDNLDWIEMVGLINKLSLSVGKYFKEGQKGKES